MSAVASLVWGDDATTDVRLGRSTGVPPDAHVVADILLVPGRGSPRLLMPPLSRAAVARFLREHHRLRDRRTSLLRRVLAAAVLGRLPGAARRAQVVCKGDRASSETLAGVLEDALEEHVACAVSVREIDDHYKPTVQLVSPSGVVHGFAKVGWTPTTATMVRREASATTRAEAQAGRLGERLRAPELALAGEHRGHPYLLTRALPPDLHRPDPSDPLPDVALDLARPSRVGSITDATYYADVQLRAAPGGPSVKTALEVLGGSQRQWWLGAWHGDWVPWNIGTDGHRVWAWDWEHSTEEVPFGFDVLHWLTTTPVVTRGHDLGAALSEAVDRLSRQPALLGGLPADDLVISELALAYVIELAVRADDVRSHNAGATLYPGIDRALRAATHAVLRSRAARRGRSRHGG